MKQVSANAKLISKTNYYKDKKPVSWYALATCKPALATLADFIVSHHSFIYIIF